MGYSVLDKENVLFVISQFYLQSSRLKNCFTSFFTSKEEG